MEISQNFLFFFSISFSTVSLWIDHHNGVAKAERQFFFFVELSRIIIVYKTLAS